MRYWFERHMWIVYVTGVVLFIAGFITMIWAGTRNSPCNKDFGSFACQVERGDMVWRETPDGRRIPCANLSRGGVDCDWDYGR